jgi:hypothetical protein
MNQKRWTNVSKYFWTGLVFLESTGRLFPSTINARMPLPQYSNAVNAYMLSIDRALSLIWPQRSRVRQATWPRRLGGPTKTTWPQRSQVRQATWPRPLGHSGLGWGKQLDQDVLEGQPRPLGHSGLRWGKQLDQDVLEGQPRPLGLLV